MKSFKSIILAALCAIACSCGGGDTGYVLVTGYAQGGNYSVKVNLRSDDGTVLADPASVKADIDAILSGIENSVSGYRSESLISRFNAGESIVPDSAFLDLYRISRHFHTLSGGAFDAAAAPLFDIWGFGFTEDKMPSDSLVATVLASCGMDRLADDAASMVSADGKLSPESLVRDGEALPKLNFNAVAQGYSCDVVAAYLHSIGSHDMLINVGGEMFCEGHNPDGELWTIGIDRPVESNDGSHVDLYGTYRVGGAPCGVVTSGNYRKFYYRDGVKYSHTIDPRTGRPVVMSLLSATIVAGDAASADALATCCMVMGLDDARTFIQSLPDVEACFLYEEDGDIKAWTSEGFQLLR